MMLICVFMLFTKRHAKIETASSPESREKPWILPFLENLSKLIPPARPGHFKSGSSLSPGSDEMGQDRRSPNEANLDGLMTFISIVRVTTWNGGKTTQPTFRHYVKHLTVARVLLSDWVVLSREWFYIQGEFSLPGQGSGNEHCPGQDRRGGFHLDD
jgi:hypothetical protein